MKCKFGLGIQDRGKCGNIYIHWDGYYPPGKTVWNEELQKMVTEVNPDVLKKLCPNVTGIINNVPPGLHDRLRENAKKQ